MTDDDKALVSELRADAAMHADLLPDRAADSITRLSDGNERLRDAVNDAVSMIGKIGQERTDLRNGNFVEMAQTLHAAQQSGLETITALRAEVDALLGALTEIAGQKKTDELETEYDVEVADFEGGYDACIIRARAALSSEGGKG